MTTTPIKIILDTDIGDDIDDAIALAFALGSPEFELVGVTTVYGDVEMRARIARRMVRLWGREDIPVVPGAERPLQFDWHEGAAPEQCSQREAVADDTEPIDRTVTAPGFIADRVCRSPGEIYILTIGACTNVGMALCIAPEIAAMTPGVVSLAGYLPPRGPHPEWNVRYDPEAAAVIARSGVPWTAIPADAQGRNGLVREELDAIAAADAPAAQFLARLIVLMKRYKGEGDPAVHSIADVDGCHVADVMTLAQFLTPERFALADGHITVADHGGLAFREDPAGPHRMATRKLPDGSFRQEILRRVLGQARD
jgi:inosine-uridine nucleoside N-ribohydrolase